MIVFDNKSDQITRKYLHKNKQLYDKLILSDENLLWIKGNNEAFNYIDKDSDYILLLNSDVEIRNSGWLDNLMDIHKRGITACGCFGETEDNRPDGWCFLIDKDLFEKHKLDENRFKVYYGGADLISKIINTDLSCQAIKNYNNFIYHFGQASGTFNDDGSDSIQFKQNVIFKESCDVLDFVFVSKELQIPLPKWFYFYDMYKRRKKMNMKLKSMVKYMINYSKVYQIKK